jgi:hypothetical protein
MTDYKIRSNTHAYIYKNKTTEHTIKTIKYGNYYDNAIVKKSLAYELDDPGIESSQTQELFSS